MLEPHGTIIGGRWKGTRAALIQEGSGWCFVRPFSDTAPLEDSRIHLSPDRPLWIPLEDWKPDPKKG